MKIDITDSSSHEVIHILTNYPMGKLEIKNDRIFWDSVSFEPVPRPQEAARNFDPRQPPKGKNQIGNFFASAADTLGSMMGPPQNQQPQPRREQ